jgi:hypothetical protein
MLWCLPCSDENLASSLLRDGGPLGGSCLNSSWSKMASDPKWNAVQER